MSTPSRRLSIWFFAGIILIVYGFLVMGQGMWELFNPPFHLPVLGQLHASLWWGALMLIAGGFLVGGSAPW